MARQGPGYHDLYMALPANTQQYACHLILSYTLGAGTDNGVSSADVCATPFSDQIPDTDSHCPPSLYSGFFWADQRVYLIEPLGSDDKGEHAVYRADNLRVKRGTCGDANVTLEYDHEPKIAAAMKPHHWVGNHPILLCCSLIYRTVGPDPKPTEVSVSLSIDFAGPSIRSLAQCLIAEVLHALAGGLWGVGWLHSASFSSFPGDVERRSM